MKNNKSRRIITIMIMAVVIVMATFTVYASSTKLSKPSITETSVSGRKVTLKYTGVKNAKEYKVYRLKTKTSFKYLKTVKASKKTAYSDSKKYKLEKSGSKYKVYSKKKIKSYELLATSKKTKASFKGKWNTSYKLVVRAYNGKKKSPYSSAYKVKIGQKPEIETYVFFGSDSRRNDELWKSIYRGATTTDTSGTPGVSRSDVIMLICVDRAEETIHLVSVYRDTALNESSKGYNFQKANKAYEDYGPEEAVKVLERNLDIKIKGYAASNFKGVADVIDAMGGITLDVENENTFDEVYSNLKLRTVADVTNSLIDGMNKIYHKDTPHIKAGNDQKLQGLQAVAYARVRYTEGSDMQRSVRQRKVLKQMVKAYKQLSNAEKLQLIVGNAAAIETNLPLDKLASLIKDVAGYKIKDYGFPFYKSVYTKNTNQEKSGKSDLIIPCDLLTNVSKLHKTVYSEKDYKASATVKKYRKALAEETGLNYKNRITDLDNLY